MNQNIEATAAPKTGSKKGNGQERLPEARAVIDSVRISPNEVHASLAKHILVDGFDIVADLRRSQGTYIYDSRSNKRYLDFFTFFASSPVGMNHPLMRTPEFLERIATVALNKPSNSDVYTVEMAEFVETFSRIAIPEYLPHAFFIEGGTLAVENALKTAFDWKVRKNYIKGHTQEVGHMVIHFRQAFHGRSGYALSLTNTDPTKTNYYPKFKDWPRIVNPVVRHPLNEENLLNVMKLEQQAIANIKDWLINYRDRIAAIIIEPIQGEGGDNHFRREFLQSLRVIADESDVLLIFDEVQTGIGLTGKMWAHQWFVEPDIMTFGKKTQVCGILAGRRIDEVRDNVFQKSSRINSTWGGNLVDMVRFQRFLEIIQAENLVENARIMGEYFLGRLEDLAAEFPAILNNPRGRGLFCAVDFETALQRDQLRLKCFDDGLIIIGCGDRTIRFRPPLNISREEIDEGMHIIRKGLKEISIGD